ncbi:MAG: efflux RND transporter permease subunit [Planctomycetes bacterium]|nr:efflux RND transporter permease subunit [Planctomycetota bacterium]
MILSDTAIRRPVLTTMAIGAIVVFGVISFRETGIDLFPRVEFPVITILSVLPGADPETIETTVTDPIEEAVATISGIKHLRSTSTEGVSQVVIEFELEKDVDVAYQEVQAKLGTVRRELPQDLDDPVVEKFDIDSAPILAVVVSGDMGIRELTDLAENTIKERLQRVKNVGQVRLVGGRRRRMWIWLNRDKLEGFSLTVQDVEAAVKAAHVELPGGRIESGAMEYVVKTKAEMASAAEFEDMIVAWRGGAPVRIRQVGKAADGLEEERSLARLNDTRAVSLLVRRQSGTNTVEVAGAVKAQIESLRRELAPRGLRLEVAQDLSTFIEHSVAEVRFHLVFGGGLAVLIVFLFLRNVRSTFISALVIPTSVTGAFILMNALGFTQNMMTLLALSLAIGLLIDDSIVVQENTMRHLEAGKSRREAASFATNEIALAVLATTLSVVAVFVPVAFMKGIVGRFFYQFGLTVTFAVLVSLLVSFTLDPMLSSRILVLPRKNLLFRTLESAFSALERAYESLLRGALHSRWIVVLLAAGTFAGAGWIGRFLRSEFIPLEDQSEMNIRVKAPLGSSLKTTEEVLDRIRERLRGEPWIRYTFTTIGTDALARVNEGAIYVRMTDKGTRAISQAEAMQSVRKRLEDIKEARVSVEIVPRVSGGGMRTAQVQLELRGQELAVLESAAGKIQKRMAEAGGYVDVDTTFERGKPEVAVRVRRDRAADLGVSPAAVASTVKALVGGDEVSRFRAAGERYDVAVRLLEQDRTSPEDILDLTVRGAGPQPVRMRSVAAVARQAGPVQIDRYNRTRVISILANLQPGRKVLGEATVEIERFARETGLPPGYTAAFAGTADAMRESFGYLLFALFLAVVMVYMLLASQFESFLHPFTIMLSIPLSLVGALGALVFMNMTMSIFTMIGIIMLMGLVTKNGILLVDYTNTLRRRDGLEREAALLRAGPVRLRPILMTTLAMIFGMLPIALGTGAGSESRAPMAVAVIGGLITSTLLTLVVVPVVYTFLDDLSRPREWRIVRWLTGSAGR